MQRLAADDIVRDFIQPLRRQRIQSFGIMALGEVIPFQRNGHAGEIHGALAVGKLSGRAAERGQHDVGHDAIRLAGAPAIRGKGITLPREFGGKEVVRHIRQRQIAIFCDLHRLQLAFIKPAGGNEMGVHQEDHQPLAGRVACGQWIHPPVAVEKGIIGLRMPLEIAAHAALETDFTPHAGP